MVEEANALPGRTDQFMPIPEKHFVLDAPLAEPWPSGTETAVFALGCFWGAERVFWKIPGVYSSAVGYAGGYTPTEVTFEQLLKVFWEAHDPTQGMRQGNDVGTQYRSAIYTNNAQQQTSAEQSCGVYEEKLKAAGYGAITTEIAPVGTFYYAEPYHQQYLAKNPNGYCGIGGTGVSCPIGTKI